MAAPTLLVGLGGTGSDIVRMVFEKATEKQKESIAFVVFDTDVNELREIGEKTPEIRTIQTSARLTVGEYLEVDHKSRDEWFPVNRILNGKALTEGAGQVRAVSRLALNTAIQQGKMAPLNEAMEDLYKLDSQEITQAPRVIITGSLCGGTGSGLILPVAMYIRRFMTEKFQQSSTIIRGCFLLPEVFDGVIKTQSERNNLRCNAYAAVREIDAFMMKDDGSLPSKYNLHFTVPRAGSNEQDELTGKPMDFCFLFDAQNLKGGKLNSFNQYKTHAANCIYGMAIAPTSKRSNSSEDNVIREIVYAGGRNRFAGVGTSMIVFPTEDIKHYLALTWTRESITDEWLQVDHRFAEQQKEVKDMRREGYQVSDLDRGKHYIDTVNEEFAAKGSFQSAIRNMCYQFDSDGFMEKGDNWNFYIDSLMQYVDARVAEQKCQPAIEEMVDAISEYNNEDTKKECSEQDFADWYRNLLGFKNATIKVSDTAARNLAYSLFKENSDYTNTKDRFRMEYWMRVNDKEDTFLHPNAARYFLYQAKAELDRLAEDKSRRKKEIETFWADFEKQTFDLDETKELETESQYYDAMHLGSTGVQKLLHSGAIKAAKENLNEKFNKLFAETNEYWDAYISSEIYSAAANYINSICKSFHGFYDAVDNSISKIDHEIEQLEEKYEFRKGDTIRYVCADRTCLEGLAKDVCNLSSSTELPASLSRKIFHSMKELALSDQEPDSYKYLEIFKDTIEKYLENEIVKRYTSIVDMDVLTAIEKEATYLYPNKNFDIPALELYASRVIKSAEVLANPFIESPRGKEPRVIKACAYSNLLDDEKVADFPGRKKFVEKGLRDRGGVPSETIDRNMILFYQAVYDLRANELSKFAPPKETETVDKDNGGEYYKAYYELIKKLNPDTTKSRAITPHIDKWWHVITHLPDLDEASQREQEENICRAFFWGIVARYLGLSSETTFKKIYSADYKQLGMKAINDSEKLIISNGTPCDHLYEVLDACTVYPELVEAINRKIKSVVDNNLFNKKTFEESKILEYINNFRLDEYPLKDDGVRSIFELPLLMKRSVLPENYHEESVIQLMDVILSEIKATISRYCIAKNLPGVYGKLIKDQFDLLVKNIQADKQSPKDIFDDSLTDSIFKTIASVFEELNMNDQAAEVRNTARKLK